MPARRAQLDPRLAVEAVAVRVAGDGDGAPADVAAAAAGIVKVIDDVGCRRNGVTSLAQWMSRRILSSARRVAELRLEAPVLLRLRLRAGDEEVGDAREDDAHDHHDREHLHEAVAALSPEALRSRRSLAPRFDLRERSAATSSLFRADAPALLRQAVGGDQLTKRLGPVPPAELRAGDDPAVLVEEVPDVRRRRLRMRVDPGRRAAARAASAASRSAAPSARRRRRRRADAWPALRAAARASASAAAASRRASARRPWARREPARRGRTGVGSADAAARRADVRRDVLRLALLRIGRALERERDRRRAGVLAARAGVRRLARDLVRGVAVDAADDVPGEAGVLERALGEDERLAASRRGRRASAPATGAGAPGGHGRQPLRCADRERRAREQEDDARRRQGAASGWLSAEPCSANRQKPA